MSNLIGYKDIVFSDGKFFLSNEVISLLDDRKIDIASMLIEDINNGAVSKWKNKFDDFSVASHVHGHIGEMVLWSCCAKLAEYVGIEKDVCGQLCNGRRDERRRYWHTWLSNQPKNKREPLDELLSVNSHLTPTADISPPHPAQTGTAASAAPCRVRSPVPGRG